jgi:hypothetical protein
LSWNRDFHYCIMDAKTNLLWFIQMFVHKMLNHHFDEWKRGKKVSSIWLQTIVPYQKEDDKKWIASNKKHNYYFYCCLIKFIYKKNTVNVWIFRGTSQEEQHRYGRFVGIGSGTLFLKIMACHFLYKNKLICTENGMPWFSRTQYVSIFFLPAIELISSIFTWLK